MPKVKVLELTGSALDWAVMKCEHPNNGVEFFKKLRNEHILFGGKTGRFRYSERWDQGGPIIEREGISIVFRDWAFVLSAWSARISHKDITTEGETPLISAMRCYVKSKLGDEVEIPKELS